METTSTNIEGQYLENVSPTNDCILLQLNTSSLSKDEEDYFSKETELLIYRIKSTIFIPSLFFVGCPANLLNMAVFLKQGIRDRVNLCLFSLSFVDIIFICFGFLVNLDAMFATFGESERYGPIYRFIVNNNILGFYGVIYGSIFLSALIACDRCYSLFFPIQSQNAVKIRSICIIIVTCVPTISLLRFLLTAKYTIVCVVDAWTGKRTYVSGVDQSYWQNKEFIDTIDKVLCGMLITVGGPFVVLITTIMTVIKLKQTISWRRKASTAPCRKEVGVTRMLTYLSLQFLVLCIPNIAMRLMPAFVPNATGRARYGNTFLILLSATEVCSYANASCNIFVYYFAGTKYRETFNNLLWCHHCLPSSGFYTRASTRRDKEKI